jgi:transposase
MAYGPPMSGKLPPLNPTNIYGRRRMITMRSYSETVKSSLLAKALTPNGPSIVKLSKDFKVSKSTIYKWINEMKEEPSINSKNLDKNSAEFKLQAVMETIQMSEQEVGEYCRKNGLYAQQLSEWKKILLTSFQDKQESTKKQKIKDAAYESQIKVLNKEITRKDKALAEVSALLVLKKKADLLFGTQDEEDV